MRGLEYIAEKLKAAGHAVVEWQGPFNVKTTMELMSLYTEHKVGLCGADGGTTSKSVELATPDQSVKKDIEASGEPMYPDTAATLGLSPDNPSKPPSVYETWAMQTRRTKHVEWWHDTWESTSKFTPTGKPIDGLITYVLLTWWELTPQRYAPIYCLASSYRYWQRRPMVGSRLQFRTTSARSRIGIISHWPLPRSRD